MHVIREMGFSFFTFHGDKSDKGRMGRVKGDGISIHLFKWGFSNKETNTVSESRQACSIYSRRIILSLKWSASTVTVKYYCQFTVIMFTCRQIIQFL